MEKIALIFGGKSSEYEVSLLSAASVIRAIDKEKYELIYIGITKDGEFKRVECKPEEIEDNSWVNKAIPFNPWDLKNICDFALPIVHGPNCEDGKLQAIFELIDIPYGGCGVLASALAMDKILAKEVFRRAGLPVVKDVVMLSSDEIDVKVKECEEKLGYPVFVKPSNMGSSVGISKAHNREELVEAIKLAFKYDRRLLIEEGLNVRELETGILGNLYPRAASLGEIISGDEFYDYEAKYTDGVSKMVIPANVSKEITDEIRRLAVIAYKAIDGEGFSRCDFFMDKDTGKIYLNEINTIPGFTKYSMFPLLWEDAGLKYKDNIEEIIRLGYERYNAKNNR